MRKSSLVIGGGTPSIDIVRGHGLSVWGENGKEYLDCTSQGWALYLGHANEEVREHVHEVMGSLWHTHQGFETIEREHFAERLLSLIGPGAAQYDRVAPTVSGGLAVETAIKLAVINKPEKTLVARLRGGFHGTTLGVAQASWPARSEVPDSRRTLAGFAHLGGHFVDLTFPESNDVNLDCATLESELDSHRRELGAVIVEPIQGSGGQREIPRQWLERLRDRAEQDGFLVIYDEIQTYIRAGRFYTSIEELAPHLVVLGKGLAGGFACGAVLLRQDVQGFPSGTYDLHTFASSALAHSVAVKVIDIVVRDELLAAAREHGAQIAQGIRELSSMNAIVGEVRQVGLHIGFDVLDPATGAPSSHLASTLRTEAISCGLLVGLGGYRPHVVKVKPPLTITKKETDVVLTKLHEAARRVNEC